VDLAALVDVFVELSLGQGFVLIRCPAPPPLERLAFELFRRGWRRTSVACHFVEPEWDVN
jgi:hypothetical protein